MVSTHAPLTAEFQPTPVGRARLGRMMTPHGPVDTPGFMPVGTQGTVKALTPGDLRAAGAQMILGNTYHLSLRPTAERIARLGGLHRFMGWDGPILTDSGGFQVFSLAELRRVDDDGVTFSSHLDGSTQRLTPERAMEIQGLLGSDIAMVLDELVDPGLAPVQVAEAMERTHRWAQRSLAARASPSQAVFGIVQGGVDPDLRRRSVDAVAGMPFDGVAIGGLSVGESKAQMAATLQVVAEALGADARPRYLMGVGAPVDFFTAVEWGIDLFDCVLPTRVARTGQVWTDAGRLNLRNAAFLDDPGPIDATCACEACRNHSRAYLAHLFRARELLAYRLATLHNVTWTLDLLRRLRESLVHGSFEVLRTQVTAAFARPASV
jgi:queuine tRNA-ribosyltransferase